jgi:anti-sigma factor RsiW
MNTYDEDRMKHLLRQALPPVGDAEPPHDLWPAMMLRLDARPASPPWFDWALAGALAVFVIAFPVSIPVFLYYL